jgi:DNA-binding NarL/FixJ family response regulator
MAAEIRILLADDHALIREGLRVAIQVERGLSVIAEAGDAETTLELIQRWKQEVVVLDIYMPETCREVKTKAVAFKLARTIQEQQPTPRVIVLTGFPQRPLFDAGLKAGVKGYVLKTNATRYIVDGIRAVAAGQDYISPDLSTYLLRRREDDSAFVKRFPGLNALTPRERVILRQVTEGKSSQDIAKESRTNSRSVDNHRASICGKLKLDGPHALPRFALKYKDQILRFCARWERPDS